MCLTLFYCKSLFLTFNLYGCIYMVSYLFFFFFALMIYFGTLWPNCNMYVSGYIKERKFVTDAENIIVNALFIENIHISVMLLKSVLAPFATKKDSDWPAELRSKAIMSYKL